MTHAGARRRAWLAVVANDATPGCACEPPLPRDLAPGDRVAVVGWPARGAGPRLSRTATVRSASSDTGALALRRRVLAIAGHEIPLRSLGTRLAVARGWTRERRDELVGTLQAISDRDFALVEDALLDVARAYGPKATRPAHRRPRTPGRRALSAGRASVTGTRR